MTALAEVTWDTPTEQVFAALAQPLSARHPLHATRPAPGIATGSAVHRATGTDPAGHGARRRTTSDGRPVTGDGGARPRARLLPTLGAARTPCAEGPALAVPPTLVERVRALRVGDRSLVAEAEDEDRGAPPSADPGLVVRRLATASVEVITGVRPAAQLARWLAPGVLDALRVRSTLSRHAALHACRAPACRTVRVVRLDPHVVEATAVVDDGRRVRAVALRLETHRGAWRATALEIG